MVLCSVCQRIPEDIFDDLRGNKFQHHGSLDALGRSAESGCRLCIALMLILGNPEYEDSQKGPVVISRYYYGSLFIFVRVHGMANSTRRVEYIPRDWSEFIISCLC
jgi:hypothetical protein